ncbi:MAG: ribosome small subunit-dependent GTPase A [Clostridia bacterium]|nr:ribosome small subunit-dependent GTPase A [Clostridia bacterium]
MTKEGIILKGIGGFYYVKADDFQLYECKAKGIFRNEGIKPLTGDRVTISVNENAENTIDVIHERSTVMTRPPIANIDRLFIVQSTVEPRPVLLIIDKLTALAVDKGIEPIVIFTKCDKANGQRYADIYRRVNIKSICVSCKTGEGIDEVKNEVEGYISAFAGNTGVGKSSLLNALEPSLNLATDEISDALGRGKHTTRQSELFEICGGLVADTPGFASIVSEDSEFVSKENLPFAFKEFAPYLGQCRFSTCRHMNDMGCKIIEAVEMGEIPVSRHESYKMLLEQAEQVKSWN